MDLKDRKILFELDQDARASFSKIARRTQLAQETVRYRINNLISNNIIEQFTTIINASLLGRQFYQILLKLQHTSPKEKNELITFLIQREEISWIGNLEGNYDIAFIVNVHNQQSINTLFEALRENFSHNIMSKSISINLKGEFYPRNYLNNSLRDISTGDYTQEITTNTLNNFEIALCKNIAFDARKTIVQIAQELDSNSDTVMRTLKSLKEKKIITGTMLKLNTKKAGIQQYKILITTDTKNCEQMLSFSRAEKRVISIIHSLATWDYEIDIEVEDSAQLHDFIQKLTTHHSHAIKNYEILHIKDMPKFGFYF